VAVGAEPRRDAPSHGSARDWWIRLVVVLQAPSAVFPLLRDQSDEALEARQDPILVVVFLAGIAGVLAAPVAGRLADPPDGSLLIVAAWAIFAGALYGAFTLFGVGLLLHIAGRLFGSRGSYRRARQVVALAAVPVALSLLLVWPLRLLLYGGDVFRSGGSDHGSLPKALHLVDLGLLAWSIILLVLGVRFVHGWRLGRAAATVALALALPALVVVLDVLR
jgi:hypothetical protein